MRNASKSFRFAFVAAGLAAALLACDLLQNLPNPTPIATQAQAPTAVVPEPTGVLPTVAPRSTPAATMPATVAATVVPTKPTVEGPDSAGPAKDPCGLPGIQLRANFYTALGTNALTAPFSGDITLLQTAGGPNIFSMQAASVQRKFVILLHNLNPATYDLKSTYLSYTEKTTANDKNPRIWQATTGFLQVGPCPEGGLALHTVADAVTPVGDSVLFQPQSGAHNTASGDLLIGIGAKIQ